MGTFFLMSFLDYVYPFSTKTHIRHALRWMCQTKISTIYYNKNGNFCLRHSWARAWWDFLLKFFTWGSTPAPPIPLVFRVVLLHTEPGAERPFGGSLYRNNNTFGRKFDRAVYFKRVHFWFRPFNLHFLPIQLPHNYCCIVLIFVS